MDLLKSEHILIYIDIEYFAFKSISKVEEIGLERH